MKHGAKTRTFTLPLTGPGPGTVLSAPRPAAGSIQDWAIGMQHSRRDTNHDTGQNPRASHNVCRCPGTASRLRSNRCDEHVLRIRCERPGSRHTNHRPAHHPRHPMTTVYSGRTCVGVGSVAATTPAIEPMLCLPIKSRAACLPEYVAEPKPPTQQGTV